MIRSAPWAAIVAAVGLSSVIAVPQMRPAGLEEWIAVHDRDAAVLVVDDGTRFGSGAIGEPFVLDATGALLTLALYVADHDAGNLRNASLDATAAAAAAGDAEAGAILLAALGPERVHGYRASLGMSSQEPPGPPIEGTAVDWATLAERLRRSRSPLVARLGLGRRPVASTLAPFDGRTLTVVRFDADTTVVVFARDVPERYDAADVAELAERYLEADERPPIHEA